LNGATKVFTLLTAMTLGSTLSGCVTSKCGRGCTGDEKITSAVRSSFDEHPEIGTLVNVQTLDHVVYLSGYVSQGEMGRTAESLATATPGVTRVVNTISVTK
jgi:osmotically-inducible protein OsmY